MTPGSSLRTSPSYSEGFISSSASAIKAFFNSSQKMTPKEALAKLAQSAKAVYIGEEAPVFNWLDRVNRLLSVLTTEGIFVTENEDDRNCILYILDITLTLYNDSGFKRKGPLTHEKEDPRINITYEKILLQIQDRCKALEISYIKSNCSDQRIKELNDQLKGTTEEEKRLIEKLRTSETMGGVIREEYEKKIAGIYEEFTHEFSKIQAEKEDLKSAFKTENDLLKRENTSHQQRNHHLSSRVEMLERELEALNKKNNLSETIEVQIEYEADQKKQKEQIRELKQENSKLTQEVKELYLERSDVLNERESIMKRAQELREKHIHDFESTNTKIISDVTIAAKAADASFKANADPLAHSEALDKLLGTIDRLINK
jgi:hypothetical protein